MQVVTYLDFGLASKKSKVSFVQLEHQLHLVGICLGDRSFCFPGQLLEIRLPLLELGRDHVACILAAGL